MNENVTRNKIPEVALLFWIMKIVATTIGETGGDYLSMTLDVALFPKCLGWIPKEDNLTLRTK